MTSMWRSKPGNLNLSCTDYTPWEWTTICKVFGLNPRTTVDIVAHIKDELFYYEVTQT